MAGRVAVGTVLGPHGVRGEVTVRPLTDFPERFHGLREVWLGSPVNQAARVQSARADRGRWLLRLEGCDTRDRAEALRGVDLLLGEDELMPLAPGSYYLHQIIGLETYTEDGRLLGRVAEVLQTGANDVYVVRPAPEPDGSRGGGRREYLVPAVREIVRVDLDQGRLYVNPIPGLLD